MTCSPQTTLGKLANMAQVEQYIIAHPGSSATDICAALGMSQTAVSRHIKPLWKAGRLTCLPNLGRGSGVTPTRYKVTPGQIPFNEWAQLPPAAPESKTPARPEVKPTRDPLVAALFGAAQCRPVVALVQGTFDVLGGYAIDGREYRGEEAEELVDEAKDMAVELAMHNAGARKSVEDVLAGIVPVEQLGAM